MNMPNDPTPNGVIKRKRDWRNALPLAPVLMVTVFAMVGQVAYGITEYSPAAWDLTWRIVVAIGAAVAVESIGNYVQWHAHDALLNKWTATAARLRRASYAIAFGVATINYYHFSDHWHPTAGAVVFALFSAASPWLWGLHTRRAQRVQLRREGQADSTGAVFSAERWRAFPVRTWKARRWSIDYSIVDPLTAWEGYRIHMAASTAEKTSKDDDDDLNPLFTISNDAPITFSAGETGAFPKQTVTFGGVPMEVGLSLDVPEVSNDTHVPTSSILDLDKQRRRHRAKPNARSTKATDTAERRAWVHAQLDAGREINGGDIDRQFPEGSRNGARLLKQVLAEREARKEKQETREGQEEGTRT